MINDPSEVELEPKRNRFLNHRFLYGVILVLILGVIVGGVALWKVKNESASQICIQVITPAKNSTTGEVRDFPTPCDVPAGWYNL